MSAPPDPTLEALWKRVTDAWDDERAHGAFLDYCRAGDRLVEAAVRYRGMAGDRARSAMAEKKLKAVALLAMTQLEVHRTPAPRVRRQALSLSLIVVFISATIGLLAYLGATR
jgi:hypothetical protein